MRTLVEQLHRLRAAALEMGGERRVARHHASGRLTARERVELLVDVGSWYEIGLLALPEHRPEDGVGAADGVITGWGEIDGRKVAVVAVDATVLSGTTATVNARKQVALVAAAGRSGTPVVFLADADGGRMPDLLGWRFGGLPLDFRQFLGSPAGSPRVLRLCAALGPCYGDSALQAASADFTVMTETASLALSGPEVVRVATGEQVTHLELGGPEVASATGSASSVVPSEQDAIALLRRVLGYLPDHAGAPAPTVAPVPPQHDPETLLDVVPAERRLAYDVRRLLTSVVDAGTLVEWRRRQGPGLYTALARIEGSPVAIAASQPLHLGGALDVPALEKHLALIELAETFNLPLVLFHDVPGLLIGSDAERQGVLVLLERIATRLSTATVPRIAVVVRKSYGGGYFLMGGNQTSPDLLVCWPSAEMGFMAPEAGVATVHRRRLEDERAARGEGAAQLLHDELLAEWQHESEPWEAAAHFLVDDVIDPRDTREVVRRAIDVTWGSRTRVSSS
jgi:acetyl-CoA carboxylase carboxyltransferase component